MFKSLMPKNEVIYQLIEQPASFFWVTINTLELT
jgi:hypothetical protein